MVKERNMRTMSTNTFDREPKGAAPMKDGQEDERAPFVEPMLTRRDSLRKITRGVEDFDGAGATCGAFFTGG